MKNLKRYLMPLMAALQMTGGLISCEKIVKIDRNDTGLIYIQSMPGLEDTLRINLTVTKPLFGDLDRIHDDVSLSLEADGKPLALTLDEDYRYTPDSGWSFYTTEPLCSGQTLSLKAEVDGIPSVTSETVVPEGFPEVDVQQVKEYSFKKPFQTVSNGQREAVWTFKVQINEEGDNGECFAAQVLRDSYIRWFGDDIPSDTLGAHENSWKFHGMETIYVSPTGGEFTSLTGDKVLTINDEDFYIADNVCEGNVSFDISVKYNKPHLAGGAYVGDVTKYESWCFHRYKVFIYRLSKECYNCLMARYMNERPAGFVSELGLSPGIKTYTNIEGGLGMFGAVSVYESDWMEVKE